MNKISYSGSSKVIKRLCENNNEVADGFSAEDISYDNTESGISSTNIQDAFDELASDFQDGCDVISQAVIAKGQTPASNSPDDIADAISNISSGGGVIYPPNMSVRASSAIKIKDNVVSGFSSSTSYFRPLDSSGDLLKLDVTQPFEIQVTFTISDSVNRSMVLFGAEQNYYYLPSAEISANNSGIWTGISTNGSSWTNPIQINVSLPLNTKIVIKVIYDGIDNYSIKLRVGSTIYTQSTTLSSTPYYSSSYNYEFGGISTSSSHYATYVSMDLNGTYIKSGNNIVWSSNIQDSQKFDIINLVPIHEYLVSSGYGDLKTSIYDTKGNSFWTLEKNASGDSDVYSYQTDNHAGCFPIKITAGVYRSLYIDVEASGRTYRWNMWSFQMSTTGKFSGYTPQNVFKSYYITHCDQTAAWINSQDGIEINTSSQYTLSRQVIKIDISNYTNDFYICYHSCDSWARIYAMWCE